MLEGITILNKEVIMGMPEWFGTVMLTLFITLIVSVIGLFVSMLFDGYKLFIIVGIVCVFSALGCMFVPLCTPEVETDRYRYEVTVGPYVRFTDIYEKYDVVERRGEIWVLEDKDD